MSNNKSLQASSTPRPAWILPAVIGVGAAGIVALLGSLVLFVAWFSKTDQVVSNCTTVSNNRAPTPTVAPVASSSVEVANVDTGSLPAPVMQDAEPESTAPAPQRTEPIRIDDVPVIGGGPRVSSVAEQEASKDETPEKLDVPFRVLGCAPSTDGRHVVAWGYDWQNDKVPLNARSDDRRPAESRLALIEVSSRKVLAARTIAAVITQVDLNATGVYVTANEDAAKQEMAVLRLSREDLQSLDRATIMLGTITSIADQWLISERPENGGSRKYSLPSLEPADPDAAPINTWTKSTPSLRLADGWLLDGVLWNEDLEVPLLLSSPEPFHPVATSLSRPGGIVVVPIMQGFLTHVANGKPPSERDWRLERPRYSPHVPAVLAFGDNRGKTSLDFFEHHSGKVVRSVALSSGTPRHVRLATTPDWIFVTLDTNTWMLPTQSEHAPIAVPFRIEPRQSTLVLAPSGPVQVRYHANNATKFELEIPGLTIDGEAFRQQSPTGEFTIDVAAAVPAIVKAMDDTVNRERRAFAGDIAAWAESYVKQIRAPFVRLTGTEPVGVPLKLEAYVRAYGKDLSVAVLQHIYFLDVPIAEFEQYRRPPPPPLVASQDNSPPPMPTRETTAASETLRTWTDTQGRTIRAKFVQLDGEVVVVTDQRKRTIRIPLDRLSEQDRVWVAEAAATQDPPPGDA